MVAEAWQQENKRLAKYRKLLWFSFKNKQMNPLLSYAVYSEMHKSFWTFTLILFEMLGGWWNLSPKSKMEILTAYFSIAFQTHNTDQFNIPKLTTKFQFWDVVWIWLLMPPLLVQCCINDWHNKRGDFNLYKYLRIPVSIGDIYKLITAPRWKKVIDKTYLAFFDISMLANFVFHFLFMFTI